MNTRIKELRTFLNLTQGELGKVIGVTKSQVSTIEQGKRELSKGNMHTLVNLLGVNFEWLSEGKGPILANKELEISKVEEPPAIYNTVKSSNIYVIDGHADAGLIDLYDRDIYHKSSKLLIPGYFDDGRNYVGIKVSGDSMYPMFKSGDFVITLQLTSIEDLTPDNAYLIITGNQALLKIAAYETNPRNDNYGMLRLSSINSLYRDQYIDVANEARLQIFKVVGRIEQFN